MGDLRIFDLPIMDKNELKNRTQNFAIEIIKLIQNYIAGIIGKQLLRSATSVGANYRSACRAKSKKDFLCKINIVEEEADESIYWLELLLKSKFLSEERLRNLITEANELTAIFTSIGKTTR
jgi:four helix bundle protein